jgi:two-component system, chemotaxis family, response regulator Rcp1
MSSTDSGPSACEILLVEDNVADANLLRLCLSGSKTSFRIHAVGDADSALERLRSCGRPDLVLLDLNLPGRDGREVLDAIRASPEWSSIPVVVLTSSQAVADVRTCAEKRANWYLTKPLHLEGYEEIARAIERFWRSSSDTAERESSV